MKVTEQTLAVEETRYNILAKQREECTLPATASSRCTH